MEPTEKQIKAIKNLSDFLMEIDLLDVAFDGYEFS